MLKSILLSVFIVAVSIWVYLKWTLTYWSRLGVAQVEKQYSFSRKFFGSTILERYMKGKALNQKYIGAYFINSPIFIPIDPVLIKSIMQKDFIYFRGHGNYHHSKDILTMNLFAVEGETWRNLRVKLTPTFTSGKMKMMFETLIEKTYGLEKVIGEYADSKEVCGIKDVLARFTTDVIGSCAFGLECNSLDEPNNDFRTYGKRVFTAVPLRFWKIMLIPHWILGVTGFKLHGNDVTDFFSNIVKKTIKYREDNNVVRKDFLQLLIQLKEDADNGLKKEQESLTVNEIIAQSFVFFLAGFETSSTAMTFALHELAHNPDIQEKLRNEIEEVLDRHEGKVTYDAVVEMKYLDMVVNETLRKFPPIASIPRVCSKTYKVPGTNLVIKKGIRVQIPAWGLHMDPEYYPNPEVFNPENFTEENKAKRPDFTFLPFGEGPRMCIGLRFGMLQTKVGLISLIRKFRFSINEKTKNPLEMARDLVVLSVKGDVWLDVRRI